MNNTLSILSSPYISKFNPSLFPPLPQTLGFYCLQKPKPKPKPNRDHSIHFDSSPCPTPQTLSFRPSRNSPMLKTTKKKSTKTTTTTTKRKTKLLMNTTIFRRHSKKKPKPKYRSMRVVVTYQIGARNPSGRELKSSVTKSKSLEMKLLTLMNLLPFTISAIDKFQRLAIEAFLKGSSVVVSAPTSSGKTLIAEAAAVATVARGRRIFYTTPLKALSNQKFRDFRETFGDENVGLLTGDSAINKDAQVLIMTTEILRNMLYQSIGMVSSGSGLFHVDVIVLDEVHFLSDISRGTVWEEIQQSRIQMSCLDGFVHGETELVTSSRRPVPLTWHFSTRHSLYPLLDEKRKHMNSCRSIIYNFLLQELNLTRMMGREEGIQENGGSNMGFDSIGNMSEEPLSKNDISRIRRSQAINLSILFDTLAQLKARDMLPAIWFIFNRRGCDAAVQYLEGCRLLDECEASEVELALKRFSVQNPDAVRETAVKGLLRGVAAHHAGCLPLWKSFIEELEDFIKVVFATETLAAGINMPARTAVISSLSRRSSSGRIPLSPNELLQMAGRAGRRGIDERGHVVLVQASNEGAEECCKLLFAGLEPLVSQFTASYGMVLNLLAGAKITRRSNESNEMKVLQAGRTLKEARKLVEKSFGTYIGSNVMLASKEELAKNTERD
ncbi:LOW QUALITY PROTEIN: hypothetical protein NC652_024480 [Populus alba x Populus x berolinensis]|nr:LOW QUALITY PROTEIN: hypothetical protein NC652_024480 [Populus alba x Populus x berolinensis]